jgi:hypothetical protein
MSYDSKYFICGTVLRDHPSVLKQSQNYENSYLNQIKYKEKKDLYYPEKFDGIQQWNSIMNYTPLDYYKGDWCAVSQVSFEVRLNILSYKNFYISNVSPLETLLRINKPPISWDKNVLSTYFMSPNSKQERSVFNGYSIYDCFENAYINGFPAENCCNNTILSSNNINMDEISLYTFEDKLKVLEKNKELFDISHCVNKLRDKYIARRMFRVISILNVGDINEPLTKNISDIKTEIFGYGPVVAGMLIYDNFFKLGKNDIYTGPDNSSSVIGGHPVVIFGWDTDKIIGDYWIVYCGWNNLGGLGIVKIKCGIEKCMLEKNVVAPVPEMPNNYKKDQKYYKTLNDIYPELAKTRPSIDLNTFYTDKTTELIKKGIICGKNGQVGEIGIVPIILNLNNLINTNIYFQAGKFPDDYDTQLGITNALIFNENIKNLDTHKNIFNYIIYLAITFILMFYVSVKIFNVFL